MFKIIFILSCFQLLALFKHTMQNILYTGCVNQFQKKYTVTKNYLVRKGHLHCRTLNFTTTSQLLYLARHAIVHHLWQQMTTYIKYFSSKALAWLMWLEECFVTESQLLLSYEWLFFNLTDLLSNDISFNFNKFWVV